MYKGVFIITEDLSRWLTGPFTLGPNNTRLIEDICDAHQMLEGTVHTLHGYLGTM